MRRETIVETDSVELSQDTIGTLGAVESLVHVNIDSTGISPYGRQGAPTRHLCNVGLRQDQEPDHAEINLAGPSSV